MIHEMTTGQLIVNGDYRRPEEPKLLTRTVSGQQLRDPSSPPSLIVSEKQQ